MDIEGGSRWTLRVVFGEFEVDIEAGGGSRWILRVVYGGSK